MTEPAVPVPASLGRRLAAIAYDTFLLFAVLIVAAIAVANWALVDWVEGQAQALPLWYRFYLLTICYVYFAWQWRKGGRTLGMRTWRLVLRNQHDTAPTWGQTLLRFAVALLSLACFGLGFLWSLWDAQKRTWHDIASQTRLLHYPK